MLPLAKPNKGSKGIPWIVGAALLINALINGAYKEKGIKNINGETYQTLYIVEVFALWAVSFIPYVRYFILFLTLPILAVNAMIKLPALMNGFTKKGKGDTQGGKSN